MRILIAEDDRLSRVLLERALVRWGHEVITVCDGAAAWQVLSQDNPPPLAILDWMMPGMDGIDVCRRVREQQQPSTTYLILLTSKSGKQSLVEGLEGGADDYLNKPFDEQVLQARLRVGERIIALQQALTERVSALETALTQVKQLQGLIPICSYCKSVRGDQNYWQQVDAYLAEHADVRFSHGICPDCYSQIALPELTAQGIAVAQQMS